MRMNPTWLTGLAKRGMATAVSLCLLLSSTSVAQTVSPRRPVTRLSMEALWTQAIIPPLGISTGHKMVPLGEAAGWRHRVQDLLSGDIENGHLMAQPEESFKRAEQQYGPLVPLVIGNR